MSKVLFLDFDGPLFPDRVITHHPMNRVSYPGRLKLDHSMLTYWKMDDIAVSMLNKLYKLYNFSTVISSSWKNLCGKEFIEELFGVNALQLKLHDDWCTPRITFRSCRRIEEIVDWMENHPDYDDCIVIDDPWSGESIASHKDNFHQIDADYYNKHHVPPDSIFILDPTIGLEQHHYWKMHSIVERWSGVTKEEQDNRTKKRGELLSVFLC